jgi:hypothetical protein
VIERMVERHEQPGDHGRRSEKQQRPILKIRPAAKIESDIAAVGRLTA